MDYNQHIADDTAAFIRQSEELSAANIDGMGIDDQRRNFADLCAHFAYPHPEGITTEDVLMNGVSVRRYKTHHPAQAQLMYMHGGGFVVGSIDTHDSIAADLAAATGMDVVSVDYRLAPEHRHPAALEDCLAVRDAMLAETPSRPVVLVGDSAGGWLASMVAADAPSLIKGQVLIYPVAGAPLNSESYLSMADAPLLPADAIAWYWEQYLGAVPKPDETLPPLSYQDLSGQPPTRIIAAGIDPLLDDSTLYAERLRATGVDTDCIVANGLPHGFLRARHSTKDAAKAWQDIITFCREFA